MKSSLCLSWMDTRYQKGVTSALPVFWRGSVDMRHTAKNNASVVLSRFSVRLVRLQLQLTQHIRVNCRSI
ncbi:unnamed protein product [Spodoptera littoralis]|uniref:Uncharacterized protein n=1 Tax=Spodoptera littoralis TaxID=7109 RepID=A0A9P0I3G0_SPOLI|nr:unnamed protein product [Spodoptera littoralis]CAH1638713.1 unnamed protein product [Spodoptera littoralis]